MTLSRRTPLHRTATLRRGKPLRAKRRTRPYGGATESFPNVGDFQRFIRERDVYCVLCGRVNRGELQVAHLLFKVSMGGRKNVSVNQPWNAALLHRWPCHEAQEHSKLLTAHLVTRLMALHFYTPPDYALARLEQCFAENEAERAEADLWPAGFDEVLSLADWRTA